MPSSSVSHVVRSGGHAGGASAEFNSSTILQYILPKKSLDLLFHFSWILRLVLILINSVIEVLNRSYNHIKKGSAESHILEAILG